ncbi:hypothetical protein CABS01_01485, partial [Colletotrichum abscissum]|uniref:uncharacterized protein n=1 Tax=Colletotrichum abscissum TaxID=1671311 RepID=UPI0027D4B6E0
IDQLIPSQIEFHFSGVRSVAIGQREGSGQREVVMALRVPAHVENVMASNKSQETELSDLSLGKKKKKEKKVPGTEGSWRAVEVAGRGRGREAGKEAEKAEEVGTLPEGR